MDGRLIQVEKPVISGMDIYNALVIGVRIHAVMEELREIYKEMEYSKIGKIILSRDFLARPP